MSPNVIDKHLAYRKSYSSNHVLIKLIENWKQLLDNRKFVAAVLMDLSKTFNCIPHDLLIANMHVYDFSIDSLMYCLSLHNVKINNT